jgi:hypothetical protein
MADRTSVESLLQDVEAATVDIRNQQHTRQVKEPMVSQQAGQSYWMSVLAHNLLLYILIFGVILAISLPWLQDLVLCWIPKAVTPSGVLSTTGAFFKALLGTAMFIILQNLLFSGTRV